MNIFDVIGPVMIGPSSSHTAGAARLGRVALGLLGERAARADILFTGSFAKTYKGHGTDRAIVGGIMGFLPDDSRIKTSLSLAKESGLTVNITTGELSDCHPNTAVITLLGESGRETVMQGSSIGGGAIRVERLSGMQVLITGDMPTLIVLHRDVPGVIASVSEALAENSVNIGSFRLSREEKGGLAVMSIETDTEPSPNACESLKALPEVISVTYLGKSGGSATYLDKNNGGER